MFSLDGLSAATVNPTLACRDTIQDKPTIVAQSLEVVTGSRGRLGIQKGPITSFWGAVIMWIMVKFFSEARQCGSGLISCPCSHTVWIKKLTDEVEKEGGREREKERKDRETEIEQEAEKQSSVSSMLGPRPRGSGTFHPVGSPGTLLGLSFLELDSVSCNQSMLTRTDDFSVSRGPQGTVEWWGMHCRVRQAWSKSL